ncbi:MAG: phosphoenolpyruvate synthase regulatory protein [Rhodospirillaceae bacterium]|nr:phosphoenolpyruvate synthase regulatory protein [Rhodospirillaceae bacterium]
MNKKFHLHLVSDSTGETTHNLARACLVQFENLEINTLEHSQIQNQTRMDRVISSIEELPGAVIYTMVDKSLSAELERECSRLSLPCINVLGGIISKLENYFGQQIRRQPGRQHQLDAGYFDRIEAMQFALSLDDGQNPNSLQEAEIVLVGVSRTSKTPTSLYLANQRGIKAANIPFVPGVPLPSELFSEKTNFVIGLTTSPERLVQIRRNRMLQLNELKETDYIDLERVRSEVLDARKLFTKMGWPIIDVSRKSIEETASEILEHYAAYNENSVASNAVPSHIEQT